MDMPPTDTPEIDASEIDTAPVDEPPLEEPPAALPPAAPPPRRLERSPDRLLGGVAGGLADYLGIDPVFVRLGFVVTALFSGIGVIAYLFGWVVLPVSPSLPAKERSHAERRQLLGYAVVAMGLAAVRGTGWSLEVGGVFWPLLLIGLGVAVLYLRARDTQDGPSAPDDQTSSPLPDAESDPPTTSEAERDPMAGPDVGSLRGRTTRQRRRRPKSSLGAITVSALLILFGGAWVLDASGALDADLGGLLALALVVVGVALVVSAWFGRSRALVALGIPLVLVVGGLGLIGVPLEGGVGARTYRPRTATAVDRSYELAIGALSLDLGAVDFSGERQRVHAQLGIGQLNVTVPRGVRVVVDGHAGAGSITVFGTTHQECCPSDLRLVQRGIAGEGTVLIDAEVGAGNIRITREDVPHGPS
jgi:phage shock protein PspC (stress-responsive transcriptional regulator)